MALQCFWDITEYCQNCKKDFEQKLIGIENLESYEGQGEEIFVLYKICSDWLNYFYMDIVDSDDGVLQKIQKCKPLMQRLLLLIDSYDNRELINCESWKVHIDMLTQVLSALEDLISFMNKYVDEKDGGWLWNWMVRLGTVRNNIQMKINLQYEILPFPKYEYESNIGAYFMGASSSPFACRPASEQDYNAFTSSLEDAIYKMFYKSILEQMIDLTKLDEVRHEFMSLSYWLVILKNIISKVKKEIQQAEEEEIRFLYAEDLHIAIENWNTVLEFSESVV